MRVQEKTEVQVPEELPVQGILRPIVIDFNLQRLLAKE
jgi:hypothetical protein